MLHPEQCRHVEFLHPVAGIYCLVHSKNTTDNLPVKQLEQRKGILNPAVLVQFKSSLLCAINRINAFFYINFFYLLACVGIFLVCDGITSAVLYRYSCSSCPSPRCSDQEPHAQKNEYFSEVELLGISLPWCTSMPPMTLIVLTLLLCAVVSNLTYNQESRCQSLAVNRDSLCK